MEFMSKLKIILICVVSLIILHLPYKINAGIKRVWAIDDSEKIKRDDINNPLASDSNNAVWKNSAINLFGAKNEIIAFQLIIQADAPGANAVNVVIGDLKNGRSKIPGSNTGPVDPFDYRGRNVELFTEHYLNIVKRSPPLWFYSETAMPSAYYTGWVPDCLIPFASPSGKGGAPFSIEANNNQGVWVDILVPKDASSGFYTGKVTITVANKVFANIPVLLKVYDFTIPDSTHIKSMFGLYPQLVAKRHGVANNSKNYYDLENKYYQMAHRHRFDLVRNVADLNDMTVHQRGYLTGESYNNKYGYAGPGENVGNTTFSIGYAGSLPGEYGRRPSTMTESSWWAGSDAWEEWFVKNAPNVERHKYLYPDEPGFKGPKDAKGVAATDTILMQTNWTHSNPGIGRNIPALVTSTICPRLEGNVDFWSVSSEEAVKEAIPEKIAAEKAKGHKYGIYNGFRPGMGAVVTDGDAVEFRVMPWIVWKYNIDQYFYWSSNYWTNIDVFSCPLTYRNEINGDGTFLYPGQDFVFPEENRNLAGPLSSIRAKNWRRGAQDFEYLWLSKQAGLELEITPIVNECVPKALWEAKSQKDISWSCRGYKFDICRKKIADLLESKLLPKP
jgi:hypothetical protein